MFSLPALGAEDIIMVGTTGRDSANVQMQDDVEVEINLVNSLVRRQILGCRINDGFNLHYSRICPCTNTASQDCEYRLSKNHKKVSGFCFN